MKNIIFILFCSVLLFACSKKTVEPIMEKAETVKKEVMASTGETFRNAPPAAAPARKISLGETQSFELDNGLTVIVSENHKIPRVSFQMTLKNEPLIEGDQAGYTSFAGQMLNRGTATRTKAQIDQEIDFIGGNFNTYSTGFFAGSLKKHTAKLMDVVTDVLYNPSFPQEEFDKIKKQTISGLAAGATDPNAMMSNVASILNYGKGHAYGEIQTEATTNNIKLETCKNYYDTFFVPNNTYLTIVGDVTPAEAKMMAEKYFGKWKKKPLKQIKNNTVARPADTKVSFVNKDGAVQSVIRVTYPVDLKPGAPDVVKSSVMNTILGGGFGSRLFNNLREDKGYTYGAGSSLRSDPVVGSFSASASVRNEVTDSSVQEMIYELEKLRNEPVPADELKGVKGYMAGGFARSLESPETIARFALNTIRYNLPADYYDTYLQRLEAVSVADVQMMAKKYITPGNANIIVVGNKDEVADKLARFDSDKTLDFYDNEGNVMEYKASAVPADMNGMQVVKDYIAAIGGEAAVKKVNAIKVVMATEAMGQKINISSTIKNGMLALVVGNDMMTFQEQKYDGTKVMMSQMGNKQVMTEGPMVDAMKDETDIFSQLNYLDGKHKLELKGIEAVDGKDAYKLIIEKPSGKKSTEFYDVATSFLVKAVNTQDGGPQGPMTVTSSYSDYKEVAGIMYAHTQNVSGMGPAPMKMEVTSLEFNPEISDDIFKIEE